MQYPSPHARVRRGLPRLRLLAAVLLAGALTLLLPAGWAGAAPATRAAGVTASPAPQAPARVRPQASGTALRNGTGLYPRVVRLAHSGAANGQVIAAVVDFDAAGGVGRVYRSTDDGTAFTEIGDVHDPASVNGLCCTALFELPRQLGALPAGTLLWGASVGQTPSNRRMAIDVWQSQDHGVTWSELPPCQTASNTGGLWEPAFDVDSAGELVCHYSDETNPGAHSQSLEERVSSDGRTWGPVRPTVAPADAGLRPGMATVVQRPDGSYYMTYEVCGTGDAYDCAARYRTSADGVNWGTPTDIGPLITTETGQYFTHAPTVAWLNNGTAAGRLVLVGQQLREAGGAISTASGRTVLVNTENGGGYWFPVNAPVAVPSPDGSYCPNYSSPLLPSADGTRLLEIATDYVGTVCEPFYATASSQGTQDASGAGLASGSTYRLINVISDNCLDVSADSRAVGGNIQQWTCNGLGPQNFTFTATAAGGFTVRGQNSGLCVTVAGGSGTPGANVDQETCDGSAAQRWAALNQGDGHWTWRNASSGLCLDVAGGSSAPGANVQQWTCNKLSPQIWKLEPR
jgi:Ricin-type beta-trefoil lectin domain